MSDQIPAPHMTSSTEVLLPGSDKPVKMRIGQVNEQVPTLSQADFRAASAIQKEKDAAREAVILANAENAKNPEVTQRAAPVNENAPPIVEPKVQGPWPIRPRTLAETISKGTTSDLGMPAVAPQNGKPSQVHPAISAPTTTPAPVKGPLSMKRLATEQAAIVDRIAGIEMTIGGKVDALATMLVKLVQAAGEPSIADGPDIMREEERVESIPSGPVDATTALRLAAPEQDFDPEVEREQAPEPEWVAEEFPEPPEPSPEQLLEAAAEAPTPEDARLVRLQAYIQRHRPLRDFRRFWHGVCPRAGFQEWPVEMQERFTELFNSIVMHPKLHNQVWRVIDTFRNGQVVGEEQVYRMLVLMAGTCSVYTIITEEG